MSEYQTEGCIKCIDDMTDDLLEIADVLEEHQINVKLDNGRYLNPVSAIRSKVDVIWDEVQTMAAILRSGKCHVEAFDDGVDEALNGEWFSYAPPTWHLSCGHEAQGLDRPNYCPNCGAKVINEKEIDND